MLDKVKNIVMSIPKAVYVSLFFLLLLVDAIAFNLGPLLEKIEIFDVSAAYNSLMSLVPLIFTYAQAHKSIFLFLTVVDGGLLLFRNFYKPKLILIKHYSFSPSLTAVDPNYLGQYYVKEIDVNQFGKMDNYSKITDEVCKQDTIAKEILLARKNANLCYYGIAHTPLIFRFGFKIGDENNVKFLHKERVNDSHFKEWSSQNSFSTLSYQEINESVLSDELIVAVATSIKITEKDLTSLDYKNKHILMFESNNLSFDCITSYALAESFRNTIMINVRKYVKKYGIKRMSILLSTSTAFTFYLGQAISAQHDPETIVYHYQNGSYPWGICINSLPEHSYVTI